MIKKQESEKQVKVEIELRLGAARQSKKTKMQEKVEKEDQGMQKHAVKVVTERCKISQVMVIGFALEDWVDKCNLNNARRVASSVWVLVEVELVSARER